MNHSATKLRNTSACFIVEDRIRYSIVTLHLKRLPSYPSDFASFSKELAVTQPTELTTRTYIEFMKAPSTLVDYLLTFICQ